MGGVILGLRYADCTSILDTYEMNDPEVWDGLRVIESAYVQHEAAKANSRQRASRSAGAGRGVRGRGRHGAGG